MSVRVVVHLVNEQPFIAEIDELPGPTATNIYLRNPRMRDGRPLPWGSGRIQGAIFPLARVSFLEIAVAHADEHDETRGY